MKATDMHIVNKLIVDEATKHGFKETNTLTMKVIAEQCNIEDTIEVSRIVAKLEELGKIKIIKVAGKTNEYHILDPNIIPADWSEKITEKQHALIRYNCYRFGFNVHKSVCQKANVTIYLDDMTSEQASAVIEKYKSFEDWVADKENWKQQFDRYPINADISHYADLLDKDMDIEKTIVVPKNKVEYFTTHYHSVPISKSKTCSRFKLYYMDHFDLIYDGMQYHQYRDEEYYLFGFDNQE